MNVRRLLASTYGFRAAAIAAAVAFAIGALAVASIPHLFPRPNPAVVLAPKVTAAVEKTQTEAAEAVAIVVGEVEDRAVATDQRTSRHVARIRNAPSTPAVPGVVYRDFPDGEFYRGVCGSRLYARDPDCDGFGLEAEGGDPAPGP